MITPILIYFAPIKSVLSHLDWEYSASYSSTMMTRGAVEAGAAAEIEVLIPEARERARRRRCRTVALAVGLVTVLAAGSLVARTWVGGGPGTADGSTGAAPLARTGAVIGYIEPGVGIARPGQLPLSDMMPVKLAS